MKRRLPQPRAKSSNKGVTADEQNCVNGHGTEKALADQDQHKVCSEAYS